MTAPRHDPGRKIDWPPMTEMHRLHAQHGSWRAVAEALGVTPRSIFHHLKASRAKPAEVPFEWPTTAEMRKLHDLHGTWAAVAKSLGRSEDTTYQRVLDGERREMVARLRAEVIRLRALVTALGGVP